MPQQGVNPEQTAAPAVLAGGGASAGAGWHSSPSPFPGTQEQGVGGWERCAELCPCIPASLLQDARGKLESLEGKLES